MKDVQVYSLHSWSYLTFICCLVLRILLSIPCPQIDHLCHSYYLFAWEFFWITHQGESRGWLFIKRKKFASHYYSQSNLEILVLRQKDGWHKFPFFYLKLACQLLVNVSLREGELAKELAFIGKIYMREKEAFPKLKSETTVIDYNFDLKLRATETLIWISHVSSLTFICIHNYNLTTHRWQNQLSS